MPTDAMNALGSPTRTAYKMTEDAFGPGRNSPMLAVVDASRVPAAERTATFAASVEKLQSTEGVKNAQVIKVNDAQDTAQVLITPECGTTDARTGELLETLHSHADNYSITGVGPLFEDISKRLSDALLPYLAIVLGLAFLLMGVVFRSI